MPIYEYKCSACGQTFEKVQKFSDEPVTVCDCGKQGSVDRLLSTPAFHLKGGGWYKDGYGSSKPGSSSAPSSSPGDSKSSGDKSSSDKSGGDSKPSATTADSKPSTAASPASSPASSAPSTPST
jgi:putative FmdB family regulatory protein